MEVCPITTNTIRIPFIISNSFFRSMMPLFYLPPVRILYIVLILDLINLPRTEHIAIVMIGENIYPNKIPIFEFIRWGYIKVLIIFKRGI